MPKLTRGSFAIFVALAVVLLAISGAGYFFYRNYYQKGAGSSTADEETITKTTEEASGDTYTPQTLTSTPKPTAKASSTPTTTPSPIPTDSICPYNLVKTAGSVKVNIKSQSGEVIGDQTIELVAKSGCKVLVNKSADKETRDTTGGSSVSFAGVPSGSYTVRSYYKSQWSDQHAITVNSGQETTVTVTVNIASTPTPTP